MNSSLQSPLYDKRGGYLSLTQDLNVYEGQFADISHRMVLKPLLDEKSPIHVPELEFVALNWQLVLSLSVEDIIDDGSLHNAHEEVSIDEHTGDVSHYIIYQWLVTELSHELGFLNTEASFKVLVCSLCPFILVPVI